ncbi:MAG: glycosyltransferase family 39 protein [ANME-2 cluster archaeon]|nr:glycosyltransferase family 39 protein [ANME-2 cluster archaeon]
MDEAISSIAAVALMQNGLPVLPSGIVYSRAILNTFLIAASFNLFGINEFAARLPSVLFGTLTIFLVYIMGLKWGNRRIAIIATVLVTFSVWEIAWSRQARMYQQLQFFYLLSLFTFYEFTYNKSIKWLTLLAFSVIGAVLSHVFGYILLIVFLVYLVTLTLKEHKRMNIDKIGINHIALALVFMALLVLSFYRGVIQSVLETDIDYYDTYIYLLKKDLGIFLFLAVPGGTVLVNKDWKKGLILIAALVLPLYFIFFHVLLIGTRYLYFVIPILFILIGYFLDFVIEYLGITFARTGNSVHKKRYPVHNNLETLRSSIPLLNTIQSIPEKTVFNIIVAFLLILAMYFSPAFTFTPKEYYGLGVNAPQSDFKNAYMYVKDNMKPEDVIVSAWTPPAQFYLGKNDYWLAFNVVGTGSKPFLMENSTRDIYTNATAIFDVATLEEVVEQNERGWLVVDRVGWYKLGPSMREFIGNNLTTYMNSGEINTVNVYGWKNENTN